MKNTDEILSEVYEKITPGKDELELINNSIKQIKLKLKKELKKHKAEFFVGGSVAKKTLIKKQNYDADVFILFPKNYKTKKISEITEKIIKKAKLKYLKLKGSRDYFQIKLNDMIIEVIPIIKIKSSSEALNITDISPLHVNYVLKKTKTNSKLAKEIMLAKAFCYSHDCYGAESYVNGFSGYSLELLVIYFKTFLNFAKTALKWNLKEKIVIDIEKHYKNRNKVLLNMNESKLISPIILVDSVQSDRNACASLNYETLEKFIKSCRSFISNPDKSFFFKKNKDYNEYKNEAKKTSSKFFLLEAKSSKQKHDSSGAKLKKFYEFMLFDMKKQGFEIKNSSFDFDENTLEANFCFVLKEPSKECIVSGPPANMQEKHIEAFRKKHKNIFIKNSRYYAKIIRKIYNFDDFLNEIKKDKNLLKEMSIKELSLINI